MPAFPPREPSWEDIPVAEHVREKHAPECTRFQDPVPMEEHPAYQQCPECSMISQVIDDEPAPAPERVMPVMIPTHMHHNCTVEPVLITPQPKNCAYAVYECPACGVIATSKASSHGRGPTVAAPSRQLASVSGGWKGFYRKGQTPVGAERYRAW